MQIKRRDFLKGALASVAAGFLPSRTIAAQPDRDADKSPRQDWFEGIDTWLWGHAVLRA